MTPECPSAVRVKGTSSSLCRDETFCDRLSESTKGAGARPLLLRTSESPVKRTSRHRYIVLPGVCPGTWMASTFSPSSSSSSPSRTDSTCGGTGGRGRRLVNRPTGLVSGNWPRRMAASPGPTHTRALGKRCAAAQWSMWPWVIRMLCTSSGLSPSTDSSFNSALPSTSPPASTSAAPYWVFSTQAYDWPVFTPVSASPTSTREAPALGREGHATANPSSATPPSTNTARSPFDGPPSATLAYPTTRLRPAFLARYRFASDTLMNCVGSVMSAVMSATPMEMVTGISLSSNMNVRSSMSLRIFSANRRAFSGPSSGITSANSSPP
ncbi:hypothetical protein STIAU_2030 [Stigmatella aurantiaca DW4/3-1]|uniref:Uncharacterized protein n=1 Tax=Stigmatella aurantiaca (strain DW4/3-1) TaxID=378806 RepID=Q09CU5_STIAD|nr:hypothetical protein STIAU_2030 [Stigmatella aurantiaca DW4/3-1]